MVNQWITKFEKVLATPLTVGSRVVCVGTPTEDLPWFTVNIVRGDITPSADYAVHFNPRFPERKVVLNTKSWGEWGSEETNDCVPFPFEVGQKFKIELLICERETLWIVDGYYYCRYEHRNPSPLICTWVRVTDVEDVLLEIHPMSPGCLDICTPAAEGQSSIKFTESLIESLAVGSRVICTGTPCEDLPTLAVNIGCGDIISSADIAVHFNIRFDSGQVVLNTRHCDNWGAEETNECRPFPFQVGQQFTIEVQVDDRETLWIVDGELYCSYAHRNPSPLSATWLQTTGLKHVTMKVDPCC